MSSICRISMYSSFLFPYLIIDFKTSSHTTTQKYFIPCRRNVKIKKEKKLFINGDEKIMLLMGISLQLAGKIWKKKKNP